MSDREAFLGKVREALAKGRQAGDASPLPERGTIGYQGAGPNAQETFRMGLEAAGGKFHTAPDAEAAWQIIAEVCRAHHVRRVVIGQGGLIDRLEVAARLRAEGYTVDRAEAALSRDDFFAADLGISNVHALVAETGSVVMASATAEPRSLSLLPPVHIALAEPGQILADLFDLFEGSESQTSCLTLITGPSKTGDIELKLVTGVHGPGEFHVILVAGSLVEFVGNI